ncbi:MAG: 4Fe-4S binding protein [Eisenbergiella massiliensis]
MNSAGIEVNMKNMNTMKFTGTVLKNLFSKPATRPYPEQPREYPDRTRGHVEIDIDTCVLCGLCSRKCPTGAITVDHRQTWEIQRFGCIQCGCCVECAEEMPSMKQTHTARDVKKTESLKTICPIRW